MKKLNELYNCEYDIEIKGIKINSKEIEKGDLFICTMGVTADRHDFIDSAIENGAAAIVVSKDVGEKSVPIIKVEDTNKELPELCRRFYDFPHEKLHMISVGGTDGKTSTATIIQALLTKDKCGYIGTNGRSCAKFDRDTNNTTPDSDKLYMYLDEFIDAGCTYVAMETSSEAYFRHRLDGITYQTGVITNITSEHLNIHGTFENYLDCKCEQFRHLDENGYAIFNIDDSHYEEVKACSNAKNILTYGQNKEADLYIKNFSVTPNKTDITLVYKEKEYNIESPLLGDFNVYNLAGAILTVLSTGKTMEEIIPNIKNVKISGRLDVLPNIGQDFTVMVDYAHTPNGIKNLLNFVHTLDINRSIVVIGQAGERDYLKRPIVGKTVCDNASYAIFCYEDPRSEDPKDIIDMMVKDIEDKSKYEIVIDRSEAIKKAIDIATTNDIVLVLGKGNETYEKLKNEVIYFNDEEEAMKHLEARMKREKVGV